jgi:RNA-directed DNA polymerase
MEKPKWFKHRGYRHLDRPVPDSFAEQVQEPAFVARHAFSPLIHFIKKSKRYKRAQKQTAWKERDIMFASHRDACIFSYYSAQLDTALEAAYLRDELDANVIAYRKLGKGNDTFSADAYRYAVAHAPSIILAFDVTDFFGSLDHKLLKRRLKAKLEAVELPAGWYQVFKAVTRYHYIPSEALKADEVFGPRYKIRGPQPIATIAEVKSRGIKIHSPTHPGRGIPQGTPISATMSNLYLYDFDLQMLRYAREIGAFYRRYSDDILFICPQESAADAEGKIRELLVQDKLTISEAKTEKTLFDPASEEGRKHAAQYLGFAFSPAGAMIRASSVSRRWRKMRGAIKRKRRAANAVQADGGTFKLSTRKLRQQFSPTGGRNFSSYARRAAATFGSGETIVRQVRKLERAADFEIRKLIEEFPAGSAD